MRNKYLAFGFRLLLGATLIVAALGKLPDQAQFLASVRAYYILPEALGNIYARAVPWVELTVGILLIAGIFTRPAAIVAILLLLSFAIANGMRITVWTECNCLGHYFLLPRPVALGMDIVMLGMAIQILFRKEDLFSLSSLLARMRFGNFRIGNTYGKISKVT